MQRNLTNFTTKKYKIIVQYLNFTKMATIKDNIAMKGMSGKLGDILVYRQRGGKTIVSKTPTKTAKMTDKQLAHAQKFKAASTYAKNALLDPTLKDLYTAEAKKRNIANAYNMALADYLKSPVINNIDHSGYTGGTTGEKIITEVEDNFKVIKVSVKIVAKDKSTLEEGEATLSNGKWKYATTSLNATLQGTKIIISATDRPNNTTKKEIVL